MGQSSALLLDTVTGTGPGPTVSSPIIYGATGKGRATYQAIEDGSSGAFGATVVVEVSNNGTHWITLGTITLTGTAGTAATDGFAGDAAWGYVRGNVTAISGTGANVTLLMGV